jgi:hypothetical protein
MKNFLKDTKTRSMQLLRSNVTPAFTLLTLLASGSVEAGGGKSSKTLPEEYLSTGEQATALANGGSLSSGGYSAVRANPAMLAADKQYTMGGGYHWPTKGRDYFQAGIVDAKTASVAMGLSYTSALNDYQGSWDKDGRVMLGDSPVKRRINLAAAHPFNTFSLGVSGGFVEASDPAVTFSQDTDRVRGVVFGAGLVAGLTPTLKVGFSAENLANKKIAFAAPTIYRGGLVWGAAKDFSVFVDLRSREKITALESSPPNMGLFSQGSTSQNDVGLENSASVGGLVRVYDLLRLSLATGVSKQENGIESDVVTTAAGGVALVNKSMTFAYGGQRTDLRSSLIHHSLSLSVNVAL